MDWGGGGGGEGDEKLYQVYNYTVYIQLAPVCNSVYNKRVFHNQSDLQNCSQECIL